MSSQERKRSHEKGEENEAQPAFKFFISGEKPIPATNPSRVFPCKTCNKKFSSFQALGGHRASHSYKNHRSISAGVALMKSHECQICHEKFVSGQALGGHMRIHRNYMANLQTESSKGSSTTSDLIQDEPRSDNSTLVTRDFFSMKPIPLPVEAAPVRIVPVLERGDSWLDLKLGLP